MAADLLPRESQVLTLMAKGWSNSAIAWNLNYSVKVIEEVVSAIYRKLDIHPDDAAARDIESGAPVRVFNDRGSLLATARVTNRARPGVVVAPSVWWRRLAPGGENANAVTSQALTDLGRAATFYDCLVEVQPA